jgi:hypothetical protein
MAYDISIGQESGRYLAVRRYDAEPTQLGEAMGAAFGAVAGHLRGIGVPVTGPAVSCYQMDGNLFHVASGFMVDGPFEAGNGVEPLQLPAGEVLSTLHVGPYESLGRAYDAIQEWAQTHGRPVDPSSMMWEEYLDGPQTPPQQTRTLVHWPLPPA